MGAGAGKSKRKEPPSQGPWVRQVLCQAPVHVLGYFLDQYDFAALQATSSTLQNSLRNTLRARNDALVEEQRIVQLTNEGPFPLERDVVAVLLWREGRFPYEVFATGGAPIMRHCPPQKIVMCLNLITMQFSPLPSTYTPRRFHAMVGLGGKLFVIGGYDGMNHLSTVECLDMWSGRWSSIANMSETRMDFSAAVLGGKIFVTGGRHKKGACESFDPGTGAWTAVPPMKTPREHHATVAAQGKLIVAGGYSEDREQLKSVECFDITTGVWTEIAPMNENRVEPALVFLRGKLFAIGGYSLSSVECLDLTAPDNHWVLMAPMSIPRAAFGTAVKLGKIYAIDCNKKSSVVEYFDPADGPSGRWTSTLTTVQFPSGAQTCQF